MRQTWAARGDINLDVLDQVQSGLTVSMIMTPRDRLLICRSKDLVVDVMDRNTDRFSYLPVVAEGDKFIGLFHAHNFFDLAAPDTPIGDDYELFSEDLMIGSDASIYEFVLEADSRPTRLVVSGNRVAGLISISDLQQLPVRASLFTLLTALEMAMSRRIEAKWPDESERWKALLSGKRRSDLQSKVEQAKQADVYVSDIVLTQLCDKATVLRKANLLDGSSKSLKRNFRVVEELRNSLAHSNFYAETPEAAYDLCEAVRVILGIKTELLNGIAES